jgi:NAD(P)-dependent dehydrogenase (short-subunit alcohol dehydrogenase family)
MPTPPLVRTYEDSVVLVAGGTAGIGLASALAFADAGVRQIAVLGRNEERGEAARAQIAAHRPDTNVVYLSCDASDPESVTTAVNEVHHALGGLDVVVSSVGSKYKPDLLHSVPIEDLADILTSQAVPPMLLTRAAMPHFEAQGGGSIINIASDAAKVATPGEAVLGSAMAAVVMFTRAAAVELKRHGVRVNAVTPSLVMETEGTDWILSGGFSKKLFEKAAQQADLGVPNAADLGHLVAFLGGPGAARITGQAISLNGGISAA